MKQAAPPTPVVPPTDPAVEQIKQQAESDKLNALQERASARTTDLLLRFGARSALSGSGITAPRAGF